MARLKLGEWKVYQLTKFLSKTASQIQKDLSFLQSLKDFRVVWRAGDAQIEESEHANAWIGILISCQLHQLILILFSGNTKHKQKSLGLNTYNRKCSISLFSHRRPEMIVSLLLPVPGSSHPALFGRTGRMYVYLYSISTNHFLHMLHNLVRWDPAILLQQRARRLCHAV